MYGEKLTHALAMYRKHVGSSKSRWLVVAQTYFHLSMCDQRHGSNSTCNLSLYDSELAGAFKIAHNTITDEVSNGTAGQ